MSGIAAVVDWGANSGRVSRSLPILRNRLRHRGAREPECWQDDRVGLLRFGGPEPASPATASLQLREGGPVLTGDLALTNGPALAEETRNRYQGDSVALLDAFDRWGEDAVSRLEGEFAFALWVPASQTLYAVRDRFGIRPLAFSRDPHGLRISSEPAALTGPNAAIDEIWVAQFLGGQNFSETRTPFSGVERLAPGHVLIARKDMYSVRQWWQLAPRVLPAKEAPDALAGALEAAVAERMTDKTGTLLSGGLDSSALTCLAARTTKRRITAYSLRYEALPELDEGPFISAVRSTGNISGVDIYPRLGEGFAAADMLFEEQGFPVMAPNLATLRQGLEHAARQGMRGLIDGHGGDEVVGAGTWHFETLARLHRWGALWRLLQNHDRFSHVSEGRHTLLLLASQHAPWPIRSLLRLGKKPSDTSAWRDLVDRGLADRSALVERVNAALARCHAGLPAQARRHASVMVNPATSDGFEILDRSASRAGVQLHFPFYDRRVVEICLGSSDADKIADGVPRALLRNAMRGILPEVVRCRRDKTDFMAELERSYAADPGGHFKAYRKGFPERLEGYVDPDGLARTIRFLDGAAERPEALMKLSRVYWLDRWLERREKTKTTKVEACLE
ncbi:asparagine synthase-related protein [Palleronia abyssalis]|uniref:asparagine synthase (glutamine-hydrolyzing) n=1 Tax=Palleronia abyssalis TaxID=1501240 RepID=A0A2R8BZL8_9RHOB|nr:asparagine synthase-related protein [Palleronia abyssalis]SPJ25536.1 Asparagine synthetase [glutamine-hydrolyzing] 3 [Palleronia abyssalis]